MGDMRSFDARHENNTLWQFVKFNLVSLSITVLQLVLANVLPFVFDGVTGKLPVFLRPIFDPGVLFDGPSRYVVDGVVTWGFVLPFFLSNFLANIYGYFMNMKTTFRGSGTRAGLAAYLLIMTALILTTFRYLLESEEKHTVRSLTEQFHRLFILQITAGQNTHSIIYSIVRYRSKYYIYIRENIRHRSSIGKNISEPLIVSVEVLNIKPLCVKLISIDNNVSSCFFPYPPACKFIVV